FPRGGSGPLYGGASPAHYTCAPAKARLPFFTSARRPAMALVDRVKKILLTPAAEWQVIDGEATTPRALYAGYIVPLAAIGPIAQVIGYSVFGFGMPFTGRVWHVPIGTALSGAVVRYVLSLIAVYLLALIIDALAPTFDGTKSQIQALKVAAYSSTASW